MPQGLGCSYRVSRTVRKVVLQDVWGRAHSGQMQVKVAYVMLDGNCNSCGAVCLVI